MPTVELRHDGMARRSLYRESLIERTHYGITGRPYVCLWCGEHKYTMYRYYWRNDDRMRPLTQLEIGSHTGPFCNIKCWELYNA